MPVTLYACQLDLNTGDLTYVNAGHNPPMHFSSGTGSFKTLMPTGMFLGFDETAAYGQQILSLNPGDSVVCYTDGVLDALNPQDEAFGMVRFEQVVQDNVQASASELVSAIETAVHEFTRGRLPYDDLTVLTFRRTRESQISDL